MDLIELGVKVLSSIKAVQVTRSSIPVVCDEDFTVIISEADIKGATGTLTVMEYEFRELIGFFKSEGYTAEFSKRHHATRHVIIKVAPIKSLCARTFTVNNILSLGEV